MRPAFTLIELLVVLVILAILVGLITVGMGNILHQARVQRSASAVVQTFALGQQMAASYRRVYSVGFNSARAPGTASGQTPLSWNPSDREYGDWGGDADLQHNRTTWTTAPLWSDLPEDQWYALMGPWQDEDGRWWQARGGMPRRSGTTGRRAANCAGYGDGSDQQGGAFGPPVADVTAAVPGTGNTWDVGRYANVRVKPPADWTTTWRWDPYGVQVGQRRFLARGARWAMCLDTPEWTAMGANSSPGNPRTNSMRNYGILTLTYDRALPAHHVLGRSNGTNEWARTTGFNIYPNFAIDRNQCPNVESFMPCGQGFDQTTMAWLGIASTVTKPMTFQPFTSAGVPDTSQPVLNYRRPVAMLWLTVFANGDVLVRPGPRKGY